MALKVFDGFEKYASPNADMMSRSDNFLQWQNPISSALNGFVTGRDGIGQALKFQAANVTLGSRPLRAVWQDRNAEMYVGQGLYLPSASGSQNAAGFYFTFRDTVAGAAQIIVYFNFNNYAIQVYRGTTATLLGMSDNNAWTGDAWFFVEIHVKIDDAAGVVDVHVDGVSKINLTGQDTKATTNAWADALDYDLQSTVLNENSYCLLDDVYYCDTVADSGVLPNNTFLDDVGTRALVATGDGGTIQWTPNSGANNYSRVADSAMDSDSTFNSTSTAGNEDQVTHAPLTNLIPIIYGVQVRIAARKDDVGPRTIKVGLNSGGTVDYGADHPVLTTYAYFSDLWVLDPDTGANWTRTGLNAVLSAYNLVA